MPQLSAFTPEQRRKLETKPAQPSMRQQLKQTLDKAQRNAQWGNAAMADIQIRQALRLLEQLP